MALIPIAAVGIHDDDPNAVPSSCARLSGETMGSGEKMSVLQLRHYTVRLRYSNRLRYRIPRLLSRAVRSVPRTVTAKVFSRSGGSAHFE